MKTILTVICTVGRGVFYDSEPLFRLPVFLVLRKENDDISELDISVPAGARDVTFVSEKMQTFLVENGVKKNVALKAALCTEEIAADYIEHRNDSSDTGKEAYMDIKVFRDNGQLEIILRNHDEPYNPLVFEKDEESYKKIGITMVQRISKEITHSYAYHLNIISIVMDA